MVRENNAELNKTFVYVYDKGGNIAQKKEYAYTTGDLGEAVSTVNYNYDSVWKDKLTAYGEEQIQTDSMGNPLNFVNKNILGDTFEGTLEWNGRQLAAAETDDERYEYSYNSDGLRTSVKKYNYRGELEQIFYYFWQGGKLSGYIVEDAQGNVDYIIKMLYNSAGESFGYAFEDVENNHSTTMLYGKNLQGDVTGVYDAGYGLVVEYFYDAWGNVTIECLNNSMGETLKSMDIVLYTPITYRGYMFDPFTGLYYLQSRYYNPTYGRFLNTDTTEILEATQGTPLGANLFAYCNNNPVNYVDYSGRIALETIIFKIICVIIFLVYAYFKWKTSVFYTFYEFYDKTHNYFEPFYVHAQNIVDYGTNINLNPVYPDYYKLGIDKPYVEVCQEAYKTAVDFGYIKTNQFWESMSEEQKFTFTATMLVYDRNTYYKILLVYMVELIGWGVGQVIGFMSPAK